MISLRNLEQMPEDVREAFEQLATAISALTPTDLDGFTATATDTFLREDGTFATAGLTEAQVRIRASFRG